MKKLRKWNTLRNQVLSIYLVVMILVLFTVSILTFNQVAAMLKGNAEEQIQQTAIESIGRYDSLFEQLNLITKQMVTNDTLQAILYEESRGNPASFEDKQELITITSRLQANADGIYMVELYNQHYEKIIPLDGSGLKIKVDQETVEKVDKARGQLVWVGEDPLNPNYFLLMRRVSLLDKNFTNGGYLLARVNRNYFQTFAQESEQEQLTLVTDQNGQIISTNNDSLKEVGHSNVKDYIENIDDQSYIQISETSNLTDWTVTILTPMSRLTEGLPILRTTIFVSGLIGVIIFFICSYFLSTYISKPIQKLTETMRQASKGNLTVTPRSASSNEINELNDTYNQLVEETNYLIEMVYEKELIKSRTELKALQAQINPHFLFNTLDSLYWSLEDKEEDDLANMVLAMSDLFRYTITKTKADEWVLLKDEIEHIKHYMTIMKMRFGDRLSCRVEFDPSLLDMRIPKLLIQPLVENAVLHGIGAQVGKGLIQLNVSEDELQSRAHVTVVDNGVGMSEETIETIYQTLKRESSLSTTKNGMALTNVERRLQLYYNPAEIKGLSIKSKPNEGTAISFTIPIIKDGV